MFNVYMRGLCIFCTCNSVYIKTYISKKNLHKFMFLLCLSLLIRISIILNICMSFFSSSYNKIWTLIFHITFIHFVSGYAQYFLIMDFKMLTTIIWCNVYFMILDEWEGITYYIFFSSIFLIYDFHPFYSYRIMRAFWSHKSRGDDESRNGGLVIFLFFILICFFGHFNKEFWHLLEVDMNEIKFSNFWQISHD